MRFERLFYEALARGFRARQVEQAAKVKIVRDEKVLEDGNKAAFVDDLAGIDHGAA